MTFLDAENSLALERLRNATSERFLTLCFGAIFPKVESERNKQEKFEAFSCARGVLNKDLGGARSCNADSHGAVWLMPE